MFDMRRLAFPAALIAVASLAAQQPSAPATSEWRTYGGDLASTRYSPLDQINRDNFNKLEVAWRFKTDNLGPRPEFNLQSTPLMVGGVLYSTAGIAPRGRRARCGHRRAAVDAQRGRGRARRGGAAAAVGPRPRLLDRRQRGAHPLRHARLPADRARREDRAPVVRGFGKNGIVDLKLEIDQEIDPVTGEIGLHAAPVVAGDVVIVGAAHLTGSRPAAAATTRATSAATTCAPASGSGSSTRFRSPASSATTRGKTAPWSYTGNTGVWAQMSVDEELGLVYLPVEMPTGDYYGGHRPGDNLFGESLVALDLKTGKRKWHYQFVHHDIWDWDMPVRADPRRHHGRRPAAIKAVAQPTKQAWVYVLRPRDRRAGLADRRAAGRRGDVPGEKVVADAAVRRPSRRRSIGRACRSTI